ncbi:hypothetical protein [Phytohabitans kaempferiae]|uniref:Lipoprotein n=1 Tax=Phytohabitans kaempferiae TaxID=1620943 RepID=A0ABV6MEK7_9ACTN
MLAVGGALLALLIAACTTDEDPTPAPTTAAPSASPTPSVAPSVTAAEQQAIGAYNGYIQTYALASQVADPDDPNLLRYLANPLLSLTQHNIRKLKNIGAVQIGSQKATVLDSTVDLAAKPPKVTIRSCLDYSALKLVYKSNQSPVPNSEIKEKELAAVATVTLHTTGQWLVTESKQGSHTC